MKTETKIQLLQNTDLFSFFDVSTLQTLAENCREVALKKDEVLFEEGSLENVMFVVLEGELVIIKCNKQIASFGPGQYLGEMSLIESKPRSASAKCLQDSVLMEINQEQFKNYLMTEPKALVSIMKTLSSRIRNDLEVMAHDLRELSIFTHDIKNCITPIGLIEFYIEDQIQITKGTMPAHMARQGLDELEKSLEVISLAKNNLMTLINKSLSHAKKIKIDYKMGKTNLASLVKETIEGIACHKYLKGKSIAINCSQGVDNAIINALDIKRVLQNLLINAGYVTEDNGRIQVHLKLDGDDILVTVEDHGCGIPEDIKPFLLKDTFTTKEDGNGLGLLSCKSIIEEYHRGRFWYDSVEGEGTRFHFTLPIIPGEFYE